MNFSEDPSITKTKIQGILAQFGFVAPELIALCWEFIQKVSMGIQIEESVSDEELAEFNDFNNAVQQIIERSEGRISNVTSIVINFKKAKSVTVFRNAWTIGWFMGFLKIRKPKANSHPLKMKEWIMSDQIDIPKPIFKRYLPQRKTKFTRAVEMAIPLGKELYSITQNKDEIQRVIMSLLENFIPAFKDYSAEESDTVHVTFTKYFDPYL